MSLKIYEINPTYIDYLLPFAPHLFHNAKQSQHYTRKYIGIVLNVHGTDYFVPLSSFKTKHEKMKNSLDFIKIGDYAVLNINNMIPVPKEQYFYVDISKVQDANYKNLLLAEYRIIKKLKDKIIHNATLVHKLKTNGSISPLTKRCNDFLLLEEKCKAF